MFTHYRTLGLILKKENRGEADQLFTIYTEDFGKLEILGRAIRKITSKLRANTDIFYLSEIEFIQGKAYKTLTDAVLIDKFDVLRKSLRRFKIAKSIVEILNDLVRGQERDEAVWQLLVESFIKLNTRYKKKDTVYKVYYYFFWSFLFLLGYRPEIYNCVLCQKKLVPEKLFFGSKEGGVVCHKCSKDMETREYITPEVIKIIRVILKKDWSVLEKIKTDADFQKLLKDISRGYLAFVLSENK